MNRFNADGMISKEGTLCYYTDHKAVVETLESDNLKLENETIYLSNKIEELSNIIIELINQDEDGNIGFDIEEIYNDALKYGSKGD